METRIDEKLTINNNLCTKFMSVIEETYKQHGSTHTINRTFSTALAVLGKYNYMTNNAKNCLHRTSGAPMVPKREPNNMALMDSMGLSELSQNENQISMETDPYAPPKPKRIKITVDEIYDHPYEGPRNLPEILIGEVSKLPYRFKVELHESNYIKKSDNITTKSQLLQIEAQDILLNCQIESNSDRFDDNKNKLVPEILISIPCEYPSLVKVPSVSPGCWSDESLSSFFSGNVAKINLARSIRNDFEQRLEGSNFKTLTQLLGILENSIKQVCCN